MKMTLSQAAQLLSGQLIGNDVEFNGVSTDTRSLNAGNLFVALKGPNFDGHHFIADAAAKKASAVLVDQSVTTALPCLQVANSLQALGQLAAYQRKQSQIPVIGLTGSCGKTTTRALTASILSECAATLYSEGSYNNDIGVPLTLLQLNSQHQYAVIEMGANHFGEIAYLTHIVKPTVALITNAADAHLEGFGDVAGVCRAKGEIFQGLHEQGTAILNADDPHLPDWQAMLKPTQKVLRFSISKPVEVYATQITADTLGKCHFKLVTPQGETSVQLPLLGRHNVANAVAAAAAAYAVGAPLAKIKSGLENASAVKKRLNEYQTANGAHIIDDSYNAIPFAVEAAIDLLAQRSGTKVLVLGEMRELGKHTKSVHSHIGEKALDAGIDYLYTYGEMTQLTAKAFGPQAQYFTDKAELITALQAALSPGMVVLVKGSRSMRMEQVVEALVQSKVLQGV